MPSMSTFERAVCQSAPWRAWTSHVVLPWALQGVEPRGHVLEIGGGSGAMAEQILDAFPDVDLTVTDFDDAMVRMGRERLLSVGDRAEVRQADATALPFESESFDTVLSFIMLHHVIGWEQAITEAIRVLRPGGTLVGYDLLSTSPMRLLHRVEGQPFRMMTLDALRRHVGQLQLARATIRPTSGRFTVRFLLVK